MFDDLHTLDCSQIKQFGSHFWMLTLDILQLLKPHSKNHAIGLTNNIEEVVMRARQPHRCHIPDHLIRIQLGDGSVIVHCHGGSRNYEAQVVDRLLLPGEQCGSELKARHLLKEKNRETSARAFRSLCVQRMKKFEFWDASYSIFERY